MATVFIEYSQELEAKLHPKLMIDSAHNGAVASGFPTSILK